MSAFTSFTNSLAVVTGGASGLGREIVLQLVKKGTHVAICDIDKDGMIKTVNEAKKLNPNMRVSAHCYDVSDEIAVKSLVKEVMAEHGSEFINLLFNNAGIVGGRSFVKDSRKEWEKTFNVCWLGTYLCTREFLPLLLKASQGVVINIASVSGLWASLGQRAPHSGYSTAKFAVRGFTESLIVDFKANAAHLSAVLVMPGHVKTKMPAPPKSWRNSFNDIFADYTPVSAKDAAGVIMDAIINGEWRVIIGSDAKAVDTRVRQEPHTIYE